MVQADDGNIRETDDTTPVLKQSIPEETWCSMVLATLSKLFHNQPKMAIICLSMNVLDILDLSHILVIKPN
jgi:hypothetical protein